MSRRARHFGGALSLLALLALVAAGLAEAGSPPGPITSTSPGKVRKVGQSNPTAPTQSAGAIHVSVAAGAAPVAAANLCSTGCVSGKFGRTTLTDDQANAILKGQGSVVVATANNTSGEISGPIVRVQPTVTHK